ncbi:unnamed protein product [Closterium sp. NIES-54]
MSVLNRRAITISVEEINVVAVWQLGYVASFATKLSDTAGSEIGKAFGKRTFLVTSFQPVPRGTEGAVSLEGTLAGLAAAVVLSAAALLTNQCSSARAPPYLRAALLVARHPALPAMAALSVLTFDHEGRPIQFDTWLDDSQLYLLSDSRDIVSLFDHTSGASLAPPTTADSATRSQWLTRDAAARLAVRNHLPLAERAHFGQHKTAKALYDDVVARYSSPPTAALGCLIQPYLFSELDHFLALDPTDLTVDLLEKHLIVAETSVVAVGAARGTPRTPFFEGCSSSPLAPSYASAAAVDILGTEDVGAASALSGSAAAARARVARVVALAAGVVVVEEVEAVEVAEVVAAVGVVAGVGALVAAVVAAVGVGVAVVAAVGVVADAVVEVGVELFRGEVLAVARGNSSSVGARPLRPSSFVSGLLSVERLGYCCLPGCDGHYHHSSGSDASICTYTRMGHHLATFTCRPGSSLYTLATEPPQVAASAQVFPGLCLPSRPRLPRPAFLASRGGSAPLLTPRFPRRLLLSAVCLQLRERFREDLPVLRLHSDRGGEFSSDLLWDFFRGEGILWSFTLLASLQQNRAAERRIGLVMEVARTSMIHAAAPHFLWPFAVRYAAHQLNIWPHVSLPETSPTLHWTGKVGDASMFRVWGSRAFVLDTSADKLSSRAIPCVFLGIPPDVPGWQFYHPTSRRVLPSQDVTFDESVPFHHLFPYRTAPLPPPPIFLAPVPPLVDPLPLAEPVEVAVDSGAARGAASGGAKPASAELGGAEPEDAKPWSAESEV